MELRHLRYFIAVAELHFGRAAQVLGISQPPLSQQIQALEQEVGARLFERTNRRVELSEAGRLFLEEARLVLAQVDKAADVARRAQLGELGELKIGFTSSAPFNSTIPQAIFSFRQRFPAVHLNLREMSSTQVAEALVDESIEVGIMRPLGLPDSLSVVELMREPLVAVLSSKHPLVQDSEEGLFPVGIGARTIRIFPRSYGSGLYAQLLSLARDAGFQPHFAQEAEAMTSLAWWRRDSACRCCRRLIGGCGLMAWSIGRCSTRKRCRQCGWCSARIRSRRWPRRLLELLTRKVEPQKA